MENVQNHYSRAYKLVTFDIGVILGLSKFVETNSKSE